MQAHFDFATKAATLKAQSVALDTEYDDNKRAQGLAGLALHHAFKSLAGASNKLENAPQGSELFGNLILEVIDEITTVESLLSSIDIERVQTDPVYAGSVLKRARTAQQSAECIDKLAAVIANAVTGAKEVYLKRLQREGFLDAPKKRYAVVKGKFTHTRGGSIVQFYTGEHCDIDFEDGNGDKRIAGNNGNTSAFFAADEVARLFDIVEA